MNPLIRSAKLSKQPLVLGRARRPGDHVPDFEDAAKPDTDAALLPEPQNERPTARLSVASADHAADHAIDLHPSFYAVGISPPGEPIAPGGEAVSFDEELQRRREKDEEELAQLRQAAVEQGHAEGAEAARRQVQAEHAAELESLRSLIQSARTAMEQQLDGLADIGAEIVFEAVAKIIGASYADRQGVIAVVREVIRHAKDRSRLVIRVNPGDHPILAACADDIGAGMNSGQIEIVADDRVVLGGCLLETPAGSLDGRLEIQMQLLRDALLGAKARRNEAAAGGS